MGEMLLAIEFCLAAGKAATDTPAVPVKTELIWPTMAIPRP